jgi:hypothetical protein
MTDLTPAQIAEAKAEAKRLRRARQTSKNLIGSLVASIGIVIFLVLVVARPNDSFRDPIDYQAVSAELTQDSSLVLAAPELDESWSSNRADLRTESGGDVWTVGLVSTAVGFVQITHYLSHSPEISAVVADGGNDSVETVYGTGSVAHEWNWRNRSELEEPGNDAFVAWSPVGSGLLVVSGTSQAGVSTVLASLQDSQPELFEEAK